MASKSKPGTSSPEKLKKMHARLDELEETLRAIRSGEVDALVTSGPDGEHVFTLEGADHPFRVMVETINEGAATLDADGLILYANGRLAEMVKLPLERLIGSNLNDIVQPMNFPAIDDLLDWAQKVPQKEECNLLVAGGRVLPIYLSLSPMKGTYFQGVCLIATDLTEQKRRQSELSRMNADLQSEIAERKRAEEIMSGTENSLRQLTGRLLSLQDEEQRRIARDLHDSTAQTLATLGLNLGLIQRRKDFLDTAEMQKLLAETEELAKQASNEIRNLAHLLHPPDLDLMGLIAAIQWHTTRTRDATGLEISLELPAHMGRLHRDVETALFRIFQESLENVRRHSGSTTAKVRLTRHPKKITLEVKDHGHGAPPGVLTDPDHPGTKLGVGVAGMRERLRQLGGRLEIESGEQGTTVRATVPIHLPE